MQKILKGNSIISWLCALVYVTVPCYAVWYIMDKPMIGMDDSNITFVYARNIAGGHGFVYNIGGEHVEGSSCLLYLFICTLFYWITSSPEVLIFAFNLLIALVAVVIILNILQRLSNILNNPAINVPLLFFIFLAWLFINPAFFGWTVVSLMDCGVYTFMLIVTYAWFVREIFKEEDKKINHGVISFLIFLIIITRPEGTLWGLSFIFLAYLLAYRKEGKLIGALKNIRWEIFAYAATILLLLAFRLWYFGYPLPNTYYSKVSASLSSTLKDGWVYFSGFMHVYSWLILLPTLLLAFWVLYCLFKRDKSPLFYVALITLVFILVGLVIPILEGGDHFRGFRFYQSIYPFLILPFILLIFAFNLSRSFYVLLITAVAGSLLFFEFNKGDWTNFYLNNNTLQDNNPQALQDVTMDIEMEFHIAKETREYGKMLNDIFQDQLPVIGNGAAGGMAYEYHGFIYDLMGLNNTKMAHADPIKIGPKAHQSFNKQVFYEMSPDIFLPIAAPGYNPNFLSSLNDYYKDTDKWDNLIFKNIFNDDEFKQKYSLAVVMNIARPTYTCYGYFNNDYLRKLLSTQKFRAQKFNN